MPTGTATEPSLDSLSQPSQSDPLPLEQTDPELAEHFRLIANRQHPVVKKLVFYAEGTMIITHDGRRIIKRRQKPGRNDPCHCGSGKKFKKCCA